MVYAENKGESKDGEVCREGIEKGWERRGKQAEKQGHGKGKRG